MIIKLSCSLVDFVYCWNIVSIKCTCLLVNMVIHLCLWTLMICFLNCLLFSQGCVGFEMWEGMLLCLY